MIERVGLALLHRLPPETSHHISLAALRSGVFPMPKEVFSPRLETSVAGLSLSAPLGLAAGYDKNAQAIGPLSRAGFGFIEVGAVTPLPQPGNPKSRLFRLTEDHAIINRFGFNNDGMKVVSARLAKAKPRCPVGLNLGANKSSSDRAGDYAQVLAQCGDHVDFATVNVSSPNTEGLRDLQQKAALDELLRRVMEARTTLRHPPLIFLKISPDLSLDELRDVVEVAQSNGIHALIATNTTIARGGLRSAQAAEAGGLSGAPLFERSTRLLAQLSAMSSLPIIGVGGISTPEEAYEKLRAGAVALQLYSGLVYGGLRLIREIHQGIDALLERDGYSSVSHVVGTGRSDWL